MKENLPSPSPVVRDPNPFRDFVQGVTDYAIFALSPEGTVASWNAGAQRFKGYTADEIIGKHFSRFYTEEDRAAGVPERALRTARTEGRFEAEGWRVRQDGTRFWAHVVIDPIRDSSGTLVGYAKITRDVTERKRTQEALHASEERFRILVQSVTDYAIYMLSPQGTIINWNTGAARIKGYSSDEVIGSHFSRFYTEEDRASGLPQRGLEIAVREGRFENEGWRVRKDGTRFWAHVVIDTVRDSMGNLLGFAKITRDITERREAADALRRTQEALFQSQKLEAIGKLTGGVAHDFNNLLGVIVTGLELLSRQVRDPAARKILDSMERAAGRGAMLTGQLLAFARQQPLRKERHSLADVIGDFEAVLRRACDDSIRFSIRVAPGLRPVLIDAVQFEASLLNLVTNARDAMPEGGTLAVSAENVTLAANQVGSLPAGAYVRVSVTDTGSGLPRDVAARALEPFFTTKKSGSGTGLGLSQVYGLVQQSDGELVIDSEYGKGTTVAMYLPALPASDTANTASDAPSRERVEKVLVVDDQPDVLNMAMELFRTLGYEVLSASDGTHALEVLQRNPDIDILFTDVLMTGMSGIALAKKAQALNSGIQILMASGFPVPALEAENIDITAYPLIRKPYRLAEVAKALRSRN